MLPLKSHSTRPDFFGLSWRIGAWLRPTGEVGLTGNGVQLKAGGKSFFAPLSLASDLAPSQGAALAAAALIALLAAQSATRLGGVRLVVSDRWLRPLVFPLGDSQLTDEDVGALVEHQYRQLFGKLMAGWVWRWDRQANGQVVAMAWPVQLADRLRVQLAEQGIRLISALPLSLHAIENVRCPSDTAWFIVAEMGCATFVRSDKDGWRHWRVCVTPEFTAEQVLLQFMRMVAQLEDDCRSVWVIETGAASGWAEPLRANLAGAGWEARVSEPVQ